MHVASDECFKVFAVGIDRGMFVQVDEADIFVNQLWAPVSNGAMGVDKEKEVDGVVAK